MTKKILTIDVLLDWLSDVLEREEEGKFVSNVEKNAAEAVFEYCLHEAYKQRPMKVYYMIMKRGGAG